MAQVTVNPFRNKTMLGTQDTFRLHRSSNYNIELATKHIFQFQLFIFASVFQRKATNSVHGDCIIGYRQDTNGDELRELLTEGRRIVKQ